MANDGECFLSESRILGRREIEETAQDIFRYFHQIGLTSLRKLDRNKILNMVILKRFFLYSIPSFDFVILVEKVFRG